MAVRVFHCDDSHAFRVLVAELISDEPGIELVGEAAAAEAAIAGVSVCRPDVVLLDLRGGDLGLELITRVHVAAPDAAIVVLSGWDGPIDERALSARLDKGVSGQELARTIRSAAAARRMTDGIDRPGP
ncbi:MAG: response regulator transcription factor [Solirubrobacterales bacterium]|jgi:DNA-binding NarL/FixJ family response regulator|nr:response regulator transcription factor [Solirubrobacterales bacterium]